MEFYLTPHFLSAFILILIKLNITSVLNLGKLFCFTVQKYANIVWDRRVVTAACVNYNRNVRPCQTVNSFFFYDLHSPIVCDKHQELLFSRILPQCAPDWIWATRYGQKQICTCVNILWALMIREKLPARLFGLDFHHWKYVDLSI